MRWMAAWVQRCQCQPIRINWFLTQFPKHLRVLEPLKVDPDALDLGRLDLGKQSPTTITAASGSAAMRSTLRPDDVANGSPALGRKSWALRRTILRTEAFHPPIVTVDNSSTARS